MDTLYFWDGIRKIDIVLAFEDKEDEEEEERERKRNIFISNLDEEGLDLEDDFALAFGDPSISRIRSVDLSGSSVTDRGLKCLLAHKLRVLNIHNCRFLSKQSLEALNQNSESLLDLNVGNTSRFFPEYVYPKMDEDLVRKK